MTKWLVLEDVDMIHVVPEDDIKPHGILKDVKDNTVEISDFDCPCKPKINMGGDKPTIIHNCFEDTEKIEKSLSNPHLSI